MTQKRVLVVEDDPDIRELVRYHFEKEGFRVIEAAEGEAGLNLIRAEKPDLVLLDLMLPGMDGFEVCRLLKRGAETASIPLIMLTAKGEEADVVAGLELGADDYVTKPFSPGVLLARARNVLRHRSPAAPDEGIFETGGLRLDPGRFEALVDGRALELTATEFALLHFLARHPGRVYTRSQIIDAVKGADYPVTDRSVDVQVAGLRRKLGAAGSRVETVHGVGYRFKE